MTYRKQKNGYTHSHPDYHNIYFGTFSTQAVRDSPPKGGSLYASNSTVTDEPGKPSLAGANQVK